MKLGMFLIIDRHNKKGLQHWGSGLEKRGIPAVIQVDEYMIEQNGGMIHNLSNSGFDIGGAYDERPLWNESYEFQYSVMSRVREKVEPCTNKQMRVFSSKYFAYDEVTLQAAHELGIEYILARGTAGAEAVVYKAEEYDPKILSVSNVPSKEMGTGSLCDESLWSRGVTPEGFRDILFGLKSDRIILVAQTHLSGVKLHWWNVYQDFFNANIVSWKSLDQFVSSPVVMPNSQIPLNTEVKYSIPKPTIPLEQEPEYYPFEE